MFGLKDFLRHEPYPIELMNFKNIDNTICELLRQTYHLTENDTIRNNIRVAMTMAKKMGRKLRFYHNKEKEDEMETQKLRNKDRRKIITNKERWAKRRTNNKARRRMVREAMAKKA